MKNIIISPIYPALLNEIEQEEPNVYYLLFTCWEHRPLRSKHCRVFPFEDISDPDHPEACKKEQMRDILEYFASRPDGADVFVCCDGGQSRSAAVAAALMRWQGEDDSAIWKDPQYHPNKYLYRLALEQIAALTAAGSGGAQDT